MTIRQLAQRILPRRSYRALASDRWRARWREHGLPLLAYLALSALISWPTARNFTTRITSDGVDAKHNLWIFWHTLQALQGQQPLFDAPLLYYPRGITLLVHGVGPLTSLFALPFWPLGPEAVYNGGLLIGLCLTGYCMYLLARDLGFDRGVALFAGVMLMTSTMCLAGLASHVTKVFLGLLPLALLALHRTLDPKRSGWWAVATALVLLATALHTGYQFVFSALAIGFFALAALLAAPRDERLFLLRRGALLGASVIILVGPLLLAIVAASKNPAITVDVNQDSFAAPDLAQYLLPRDFSLLFGSFTQHFLEPYVEKKKLIANIETAVALSWIGLALCLVGLLRGGRPARRWLLLGLLCVLLSLGPSLHWLGRTTFTQYNLPIILPYAFLTGLPGLEFMRAPGRFMMMGFTALAVAAAYGLAWLTARFPRHSRLVVGAAIALALLEAWPRPFPQERLAPVPPFYQQIARDGEQYGVLDLPFKSSGSLYWNWATVHASSFFQMFQMTHHKGIAGGYISRTYDTHPIFGDVMTDAQSTLFVNGRPANYVNFLDDLARNNYRYVVWHKKLFANNDGSSPNDGKTLALLAGLFGAQPPIVDDELTRVYRVEPLADTTTIRLGKNWNQRPSEAWTWAASPATLTIASPRAQRALLQLQPALIHDPNGQGGLGAQGVLHIESSGNAAVDVPITVGVTTTVPLALVQGSQTLTLTLQAGNFRPSDYGTPDKSVLSFAIQAIDLRTGAVAVSDAAPAGGSSGMEPMAYAEKRPRLHPSISIEHEYAILPI